MSTVKNGSELWLFELANKGEKNKLQKYIWELFQGEKKWSKNKLRMIIYIYIIY